MAATPHRLTGPATDRRRWATICRNQARDQGVTRIADSVRPCGRPDMSVLTDGDLPTLHRAQTLCGGRQSPTAHDKVMWWDRPRCWS
jgi:hypothetical protein